MIKKRWVQRVVIGLAILVVLGGLAGVATVAGIFWWYGRGVAALDEERLKNYRPPQVTRILSRDGDVIGELYEERRTFVDYAHIPSHVENAFLAAEDADFYRHEGMDYAGMVRALIANVRAGEIRQGASTITQQVVKIFMLSPERTFERKVQELILARRLEQAFSKKQILELYLNEIYLGHGRYGIEEASRFYFGKGVAEIDLGQAALLATLPKAPGRDSPLKHPDRSKRRQVYVLEQMVGHGFVSAGEAQRYIDDDELHLADPSERPRIVPGAEEFVDAALGELREHYGADALGTLGGEVWTTVSLPVQARTRASLVQGLAAIDRRNGYARSLKPAKDEARKVALEKGKGPASLGRKAPAVVLEPPAGVELPSDGFPVRLGTHDVFVRIREGSRHHDPELELDERFPPGAVVEVEVVRPAQEQPSNGLPAGWAEAELAMGPEAAVIVVEVKTGEVLAMIGGSTYRRAQFNRVLDARRQPGSAFKPFVYGAALHTKQYSPATLVSDSPEIYQKWKPTNFSVDKYLGDVRLRVALAKSINTIAVKLADRVGIEAVQDFARVAGIESDLPDNLSLALGTGEVTPFELARAYLTLARQGERIEPRIIKEVRAPGGLDWVPEPQVQRALPEDVTFVLASMLQSVVEHGTGTKAKALGRPVAGKTGTSDDAHDAWFAGFTPGHVAVTWVGFDRPRRLGKGETGGKAAIPIWVGAMEAAEQGEPAAFVPPSSVVVRQIDAASGLLVPSGPEAETYQGETLEEYFVAGTEPIDEAVPAALPAGDVLLGLYDEEGQMDPDPSQLELELEPDAPTPAPEVPHEPPLEDGSATTKPRVGRGQLPSLGDDL